MRIKQTARKSCTKSGVDKYFGKGIAKKICTTIKAVNVPANDVLRPPRRRRASGAKALKEIRRYHESTKLLIKRLPFQRLIRSICEELNDDNMRLNVAAMEALQEGAENFVIQYFENINLCAIHAKRSTIMRRDIRLAQKLRRI